jgi:hypothetical protein
MIVRRGGACNSTLLILHIGCYFVSLYINGRLSNKTMLPAGLYFALC